MTIAPPWAMSFVSVELIIVKNLFIPMKHSVKEWVAVTRYWSFSVSAMPVVATFAYLFWSHEPGSMLSLGKALVALVGVVVLHAAGNVLSDYYDYKTGVDNEQAFAVPNLVFHKFEPKEYLVFSIVLFAIGVAIGLFLTWQSGPVLLLIGGAGVVLTLLYSWLKYHALGDLDIFIIFAVLPVLGTSYVATGSIVWDALVLTLPFAFITVSVLHINNTIDIESDRAAGMRSFAMLLGKKNSVELYMAYQLLPFLCVVVAVALRLLPWYALLCLVALIPASKNVKAARAWRTKGQEAILGLDQATAKLHLVFSLLLSVGLLVAAIVG